MDHKKTNYRNFNPYLYFVELIGFKVFLSFYLTACVIILNHVGPFLQILHQPKEEHWAFTQLGYLPLV
jgi:hypothetical protein